MDERFRYVADVTLELSDGSRVRQVVRGTVEASDKDEAERIVEAVVGEQVMDFGCEKVDAPVESFEVHSVKWER